MKKRMFFILLFAALVPLAVGGWIVQGIRGAFRPVARLRPRPA